MDDSEKKRLISHSNVKSGNVRCITITDNVPEHWDSLIAIAKSSYDFWAYIIHDSDEGVDSHIHLLCLDKGGTTLKAHCQRFSSVVLPNFVEKVFSPRAMARYLIHKDDPKKFQYSPTSVVTNSPDKYAYYLLDPSNNVVDEFKDFLKLMNGEISIFEYLDMYRGEFSTMPFYQKQALFHKIVTSSYYTKAISPPPSALGSSNNFINLKKGVPHGITAEKINQ